jgi:NADH dehydrogenase FAD-containing subunit
MAILSRRFLAHSPKPRILIAGANFAGLAAARGLDSTRFRVTLIDPSATVDWLPNAHELLSRRKTPDQLTHDRSEVIRRLGHEFIMDAVQTVDPDTKRLTTRKGQELDYDILIMAIGNSPRTQDTPGAFEHAHSTKTIADCQRISNSLTRLATLPGRHSVVIVGAGAEGLEMTGEILRRFGHQQKIDLHLVEAEPTLFRRFPELHEHLVMRMGKHVALHCGARVSGVSADSVLLENGTVIPSRLTLWTAGNQGHPLLSRTGLAPQQDNVLVTPQLQCPHHPDIFVIGDAANLPSPLDKQAFHAQDMGRHVATQLPVFVKKGYLPTFLPRLKPSLITFGDRDGLMVFGDRILASPSLIGLKEAIYQYGYHELMPPRSPHELSALIKDLRHGINTLDTWRMLAGSAEARLFQAR